ncbi:Hypothetical protein SMAX5B_013466 [Scophthalmus maximus]|uniref:Uncharacterized protein n=1 Tax=Scophthalmus maximus TaxID=52904 RepID=A0A2U9B4K1_SCOMX|nr:Hypothetical protein SMAX5B_013466 [Scophthalmus maximus]
MAHTKRVLRAQLYPEMNSHYSLGDRMSPGVTCSKHKDEGKGKRREDCGAIRGRMKQQSGLELDRKPEPTKP